MKYKLLHETKYEFSNDVFLEPHYLRFRPKNSPFAKVSDISLTITPVPEGYTVIEDVERNIIDFCWFEELTSTLSITAKSEIETTNYNPFNFLIYPESYSKIPFTYNAQQYQILQPSLQTAALNKSLKSYADRILQKSSYDTISFVTNLTSQLHQDFAVEYRETGAPLNPTETFNAKVGSCRDLSWLQINLLRNVGIASRFVSGYFYFEIDKPVYELHAWVEVYTPSIGWLGFDPSHGILAGNTHFAVASSAFAENTMPVTGGIRGSASSILSTHLHIEKV